MLCRTALVTTLVFCSALPGTAQDESKPKPAELEHLKAAVGVWDAEFEVWAQGPDQPPLVFSGVETNHAFGEYWIASDLVSEYMGTTMKVHSIIGYDLDQKKLVGTVVDDGPYSAKMTGEYDAKTKSVTWITKGKGPGGTPLVHRTTMTQKSAEERVLVLNVPGKDEGEFTKFMQIRYVKRKP